MAAQIVLIIICLGVGFFFGKKGLLNDAAAPALVRLTVDAILSCALFSTMRARFSAGALLEVGPLIILPFTCILALFLLALFAARLLRLPTRRRGIFASMAATSNTIFLGLPINLALLGADGLSGALMYYMGNTIIFWSLCTAFLRRDGEASRRAQDARADGNPAPGRKPNAALDLLKALASPPLIALALSLVFIFSGWPLPGPLSAALESFGSLASPLALVYMGFALSRLRKADLLPDRGLIGVVVFRTMVSPLLAFALVLAFQALSGMRAPRVVTAAFLLQAAMPVMSQSPIVARREGSDEAFAARAAGISLLFCPIPLALIMVLY
jgi:malate permease and related proteins